MRPREIFYVLIAALIFFTSARAQQWDWVQRFSGDGAVGTAVGVDDAQNVYVAGTFSGTNYIGTNRIASDSSDNLFIAKLDPYGIPRWTITASGTLTKMLVTSNGSVFVCGALAFNQAAAPSISNVFLARLDEGQLSWIVPLPEGVVSASSMAFGGDETIYLLAGTTNQAFVRRYTQGGAQFDALTIQRQPFTPLAISIGPLEEIYVMGKYAATSSGYYVTHFTARVLSSGEVLWQWERSSSTGYRNHINSIMATSDGGVVSVGVESNPLPEQDAIVVKHSPTGTQEWRNGVFSYFKTFHSANAVTVDTRGNVHITGTTWRTYYDAERLMVLTLSPNGERLSFESIASYVRGHGNFGHAIASDKDGAVIVSGTLQGQTVFGSNRLSHGAGGFVARRSTLFPQLTQQQVGNEIILSWPTTALPFALQQSIDGTSWSFVDVPPQRTGWRNQTVLPAPAGTIFRLFGTNEPPIRHPPRIFPLYVPGVAFLDHAKIVIPGSSNASVSRLAVYFDDEDDNPLTVTWTNLQTGEPMTNGIAVWKGPAVDDWNIRHGPYYQASVALEPSMFLPGRHSVSVSVSDGTSTVTENYPVFEVISFEDALAEFVSALEALRADRSGRQSIAFWEGWLRALDRDRSKLSEKRWTRFQRQLARVKMLNEEERGKLSNAAELLKPFLVTQ